MIKYVGIFTVSSLSYPVVVLGYGSQINRLKKIDKGSDVLFKKIDLFNLLGILEGC